MDAAATRGVETAAPPTGAKAAGLIQPKMAPGNPGVPSDPTVLFEEDFENVPGTAPVILDDYVSVDGHTYTAAPLWLSNCNGVIVNFNIPYTTLGNCVSPVSSANLRQLVYALGVHGGAADANSNDAVSAYTENNPGVNAVEFETVEPLPLATASGRFLTFSVDTAAKNCQVSPPLYQFSFVSDAGTATPVGGQLNACSSGATVPAPAVGGVAATAVSVGTYTSNGSVLFDGASLGIRMANANGSGVGNDAAFDNIRILDVTPQLDKAFSPTTVFVDGVSTLTFTVTNTSELAAKAGWGFTDTLPEGLVIAEDPNVAGSCVATTTAPAGGNTIEVAAGNLPAGVASCTISVEVTAAAAGTYTNGPGNVTETGLNPPADTTLTVEMPVQCAPGGTLVPVDLIQNPSFESRTQDFQNSAANSINYATGWHDSHSTGGQYHVFSPTFDSGPAAGSMPIRAGADGYGFMGGHSSLPDVGEGATNTLIAPLDPLSTYVGYFSLAAGGYSRQGDGYMQFFGVSDPEVGHIPAVNVVAPTAANSELLFSTPVVEFPGVGVTPQWERIPFTLNADQAWPYLRVEVRNANPANNGTVAGQVWMNFDDFHLFECQFDVDLGDAPATYGTDLAANGARHNIVPGTQLGGSIDGETDGQPNAAADGDGADEDGVVFNPALGYATPTLRTGLDPASLQPIENTLGVEASADGFVSAWVDWNQDGAFTDDERVANAQPVTAGTNEVSFVQGVNPAAISTFVRVRYSTDAASIATPTGAAPDGEVEDYEVLIERLVQPDGCVVSGAQYYAFTYPQPVNLTGNGSVGSSALFQNVSVVDGVAVDMLAEVIAGSNSISQFPPNGFIRSGADDAGWLIFADSTIRYSFFEAGTTTPVDINGVFTVTDMDDNESATFSLADLASYAVTEGSAVGIVESGGSVTFDGNGNWTQDPESRFQFVLEGQSTFDVRWRGGSNSGFAFDGDGDFSIDPPACSDFGDAPDSYGTTAAANGARHQITPGVTLGDEIDFDPDGQPTADAAGDDANRVADEDGVADPIVVTIGDETAVTVSATNSTTGAATLAGWIDLDGSGTFDAAELVTVPVPASSGTADYVLTFPVGTVTADTFARFRLFPASVTAFLPTGAAPAGEVEDYAVAVVERELSIEKSSDMTADSRVGDDITYTVTVTNTGTGDYTDADPAVVFDDLAGVLDDADYNGDAMAEASDGSDVADPAFVAPSFLLWSGPLAAGESVTITYTVTLAAGGDGTVRNVAWEPTTPPEPGVPPADVPACDPPTQEGTDPVTGEACGFAEAELPKLSVVKTSDTTDLPADGATVTYTVTVTNDGPGDFSEDAPATMTDDLSDVLDDAAFGDILTPADGAEFDAAAEQVTWSGPLAAGESIDISYTVVYDATTGDNVLLNRACVPADDATDPEAACDFVQIPAAELVMDKTVDPADGTTVVAGQEVTYTLTFQNIGQSPAAVDAVDTLTDVLDDATLTGGPTADAGLTAALSGDELAVTGDVPVGETLTVTYTVTVDAYADQGDHVLGNVLSNADGSCPPEGCPETENPIRHLSVEKSADPVEGVQPGDVVTYTVTVTNDGEADYTVDAPAVISDDMTDVLDDATYNGDAVAVTNDGSLVPAPVFAAPTLTWSGALPVDGVVTITYSVTVTNLGDHDLVNSAGPVCAAPEICDPPTVVEVLLPSIVPAKSSDPASGEGVEAGDVITYTLTFTNEGQATGDVNTTDDLTDVLDDGTITSDPVVDDAHADEITAVFDADAQTIVIAGPLAPGETATVTYEVTIGADGERGDNVARNVATPEVPPFVPPADCDPVDCPPFVPPTTEHPIGELVMDKSVAPASGTTVDAGQQVVYTLTFSNTGEAPVTVDALDDLSDVLDDATLTAGPTAGAPLAAALAGDELSVTGELAVDAVVTVTYTVTVNAFADQGDHVLGNVLGYADGTCPADDCPSTENPIRHFSVDKSASPVDAVNTGDVVTYTVTVTNDGAADYTAEIPASVTDDMTDVLDDATYNDDASAVIAGVTVTPPAFSAPTLSWSGALPAGETATITYSVTVTNLGDHDLVNVASPVCADGVICDPPTPPVEVLLPSIVPAKSSDPESGAAVNAGDVITYTLTFTNEGQAAGPVDSTDDLSDVLDDAEVTSEPVVEGDGVTAQLDLEAQEIRVTGDLAPGATATVTYQVTVLPDGERGDDIAGNVLTPDVPPYQPDPDCEVDCVPPFVPPATEHPIGELDDWKTVDPASGGTVQPGQQVTYTLHFQNTGEAVVPVSRDDVLTGVLDDATITAAPVASDAALTVSDVADGRFSVTGALEPGQVVTVSYTVTVNADGQRGDDRLGNFLVDAGEEPPATCEPADAERADCTINHVSNVVASKSSDPASGTALPQGASVTYTLTFENVSANPDAAAAAIDYTDHLGDVLDDATLTNGPVSSEAAVTATRSGNAIQVTGEVASGDTVTVTYTVVVKAYDQQGNHALGNVIAITGEDPVCAAGSPLCTRHDLTPPPPLAVTGGDIAWTAAYTGIGLLILGAGAFLIARRRRADASASGSTRS